MVARRQVFMPVRPRVSEENPRLAWDILEAGTQRAGKAAGEGRPSAVSVTQRDHIEITSVHPRGMDRRFVGFGAAVRKIRLLQTAGRNLRKLLGESDHGLVGKARGDVLQPVNLCLSSRDDARIAMADTDGDDAAKKIQILLSLYIPNVLHRAVIHGQRIGVIS